MSFIKLPESEQFKRAHLGSNIFSAKMNIVLKRLIEAYSANNFPDGKCVGLVCDLHDPGSLELNFFQ